MLKIFGKCSHVLGKFLTFQHCHKCIDTRANGSYGLPTFVMAKFEHVRLVLELGNIPTIVKFFLSQNKDITETMSLT